MQTLVGHISQYISTLLQTTTRRPLFVGLQGPQGSGKTYTSRLLQNHLSSPPLHLRAAVLSIDDLYLPHAGLRSLAEANPGNSLLRGRGQPGTHDIDLGLHVLAALKDGQSNIELPRFDKSLHNGEGDRLPMDGSGVIIRQPPCLDVIILEGWFVGFFPIMAEEIERRWREHWVKESSLLGICELAGLNDIVQINEKLRSYVKMWDYIDTLVQLVSNSELSHENPSQYSIIYKWRLEQEHYMKANNGGVGMSDDAVKMFVDRYIPGYVFFGDTNTNANWTGKGLKILLDKNREMVGSITF
ncbi:hypothetical protein APHAL10511_004789 [Amanita phalloides]|nr:hypothetical protein APHAL10511_004789 [Amanita phalloides]